MSSRHEPLEQRGVTSAHTALRAVLLVALVVVSACSVPLTVRRIAPTDYYQTETRSALLSSSDVSDFTRTVLRRHDRLERYLDDPDDTMSVLRASLIGGTGGSDELFALAELALFDAQRTESPAHYLAAAVYAYAFLFPDTSSEVPDAFDPRTRAACDMYNRALAKAFQRAGSDANDTVELEPGTRALPFGTLTVSFDPESLTWHGYRLTDLAPVGEIEVTGMRNRYRVHGIGAPLAARPAPSSGTYRDEDLIGPFIRVGVTAVLRIDRPRQQVLTSAVEGRLEAHATADEESIRIGDRIVALEADPTAVLATTLTTAQPWNLERALFFGGAGPFKTPTLLRALQPYQRGKIPVVFVHGTASSVFRWADLANDLYQDRRIRSAYQFWFYTYDSGAPILYSAYNLRRLLTARVAESEGDGPDPALHHMVVLGHSQGGLLTKLTVVDSGDRFWSAVSSKPFDEVPMSSRTRDLLRDGMFVTPLPFVQRVIFLCTPHRGSFLAGSHLIRRLMQSLIRLPSEMATLGAEIAGAISTGQTDLSLERLPTSIDNMDPRNRFIRTLSTIPLAPGVVAHSIIAVDRDVDVEHGDDGVVQYQSAHIDGVASELVVRSRHSAQANPHTVAEVQRILLEHLAAVRAESTPPPAPTPTAGAHVLRGVRG